MIIEREKTNRFFRIEVNNGLIQLCCDYMNRMFVETAVLMTLHTCGLVTKELNILFLRMDISIN
jgi:hypothetical protein